MGLLVISALILPLHWHDLGRSWLDNLHRRGGGGGHEFGCRNGLELAAYNLIGDHRLIGIDRDMFHNDLLLTSPPMLIKPLCQQSNGPGRLIGQGKIFRAGLEILWGLLPGAPIQRQCGLICNYDLSDEQPSTGSAGFMSTMPDKAAVAASSASGLAA
jgi:hypothetical protein